MSFHKRSFFEKLTGSVHVEDEDSDNDTPLTVTGDSDETVTESDSELSVDMYQTPSDIIIRAIIAGCRPEDIEVEIARDSVTVKGERHEKHEVQEGNYIHRELFWGTFSRTLKLPAEVEPEEAEATEKHGILMLRLPKIDKAKKATVKVRTV
jgi:HSP20 family protein